MKNTEDLFDLEHLTPYIKKRKIFKKEKLRFRNELFYRRHYRLTVDYFEDLITIRNIIKIAKKSNLNIDDNVQLIKLIDENPNILRFNKNIYSE